MSRCGFVALAGRPNVGKSTLINAIVGEKVAIVSDRPQTTRRVIRGVLTDGDCQVVLVDLPGVQRPRDALTTRMAGRVREEVAGADVILLVIDGVQGVGPGDRFIAKAVEGRPAVAVAINKIDRLSQATILAAIGEASAMGIAEDIFPISARTGIGVGSLIDHLKSLMPVGPLMFASSERSDQPLSILLGELIREAAVRRTFHEVPHAIEVVVEEIDYPRDDLARVRALIWVETDSQKRILVGSAGHMVKAIGIAARKELQRELSCRVHLDLSVRVRRDWRADEALLDRLGID